MATKLGEAFVEVTARDAKLKTGLTNVRKQATAATAKPITISVRADTRDTIRAFKQLSAAAVDLRARMFRATPGSGQFNDLKIALQDVNSRLAITKARLNDLKGGAQATGVSSALGGLAKGLKALALAAGLVIGARAVIGFGKNILEMAMNAVESENLFDVSMGSMAKSTRAWSETLGKALGLNRYAVRQMTGTFNVMLGSLGLGMEDARAMSQNLTQLAYDMSSFYNLEPADAFEKLQSGISGEIEPLRRLGIVVNETMIKNLLLKQGIRAIGGEFSEAQKSIARYQLIMSATGKAQGDLARTAGSPANLTRRLKAQWEEKKIDMGKAIMPWYEKLLRLLLNIGTILKVIAFKLVEFMMKIKWGFQDALNPAKTYLETWRRAAEREVERTAAMSGVLATMRKKDKLGAVSYGNTALDASRYARDATEEEAEGVMELIKKRAQLSEEMEEAQRKALGWISLGDLWKKSMVAGLEARFGPKPEGSFEDRFARRFKATYNPAQGGYRVTGLPAPMQMNALIDEYRGQKENDRAVLDTLKQILDVNRRLAPQQMAI